MESDIDLKFKFVTLIKLVHKKDFFLSAKDVSTFFT